MDLNLVIAQTDVLIVVETEEYVQIKVFLQYNKLVLNALVVAKKLLIHVAIVMDKGNKQTSKKISVTIPKGVDDGTRIRLAGKGEAGKRGGATGDLYLFINVKSHNFKKI